MSPAGIRMPAAASRGKVVIGIDPGLASVGYGLIEERNGQLRHIAHGCITTLAGDPSAERLQTIFKRIIEILELYRPEVAGVEDLYFFRNVSSALPVAEARGVIKLAFAEKGIKLAEFTPNSIKKAVTGTARADKSQVQEMVRVILGLPEIPAPDHAADALAAAICRLHHEGPAGLTAD